MKGKASHLYLLYIGHFIRGNSVQKDEKRQFLNIQYIKRPYSLNPTDNRQINSSNFCSKKCLFLTVSVCVWVCKQAGHGVCFGSTSLPGCGAG